MEEMTRDGALACYYVPPLLLLLLLSLLCMCTGAGGGQTFTAGYIYNTRSYIIKTISSTPPNVLKANSAPHQGQVTTHTPALHHHLPNSPKTQHRKL
ncbi:hypothetical protein B9Z19DRAFT_258422 [Tuber borchii]|uniref:Uncharacterized protein n=1 Tax=Tuber borchii TaxID=42251 RepID=A0A2T6ZLK6_TUBBO|nr:hypothetical protein B9Z19DRAFT_258422 [Tuber borchii]